MPSVPMTLASLDVPAYNATHLVLLLNTRMWLIVETFLNMLDFLGNLYSTQYLISSVSSTFFTFRSREIFLRQISSQPLSIGNLRCRATLTGY